MTRKPLKWLLTWLNFTGPQLSNKLMKTPYMLEVPKASITKV